MPDPIREWWYRRHHKKYLKELDKVLEEANVPKKDVVVGGSAVIGAEGLRRIDDLDIAPTPEAFRKIIKAHNLKPKTVRVGTSDQTQIAKLQTPKVQIEFAPLPWTTVGRDMFGKATTSYHGYPHWDLKQVRKYKDAIRREKDVRDIKLIDKHLAKHSSFQEGFQEELEKIAKKYKCRICGAPATNAVRWADGRAIVPCCAEHKEKARNISKDVANDPTAKLVRLPL